MRDNGVNLVLYFGAALLWFGVQAMWSRDSMKLPSVLIKHSTFYGKDPSNVDVKDL